MSDYPKGSEWRLWDLHIHTPASYCYQGGRFSTMNTDEKSAAISQIISNMNESDVAVYAINDYFTFDGYLELKSAHDDGDIIDKTLFPAIELRIEAATPKRMNIHVLFSNELTLQDLSDFKNALTVKNVNRPLSEESLRGFARQLGADKARLHGFNGDYQNDPKALLELGYVTAEITKESFEKALRLIPEDKRLVMIPYDCHGGIEEINWQEHMAEDMYWCQLADVFEERRAENIDLFNGLLTEENKRFIADFQHNLGGHPKPCVSGSDGHSISDFKTWRSETVTKKTWIKADPTFNGLRQILFEPADRVRIQETTPRDDYSKSFIGSIEITKEISPFPENERYENPVFGIHPKLELNPNLVCLIGGRGTGKSCLIDYFGSTYGASTEEHAAHLPSDAFRVIFNKNNEDTTSHHAAEGVELPFVYISQNEVKNKIAAGSVGEEIKRMLGVHGLSFDIEVDQKIRALISDANEQKNWFLQTDEKGELIYDEARIRRQIARIQSLLDSITTEQNKEKLEQFTTNIAKISNSREKLKQLSALKDELAEFKANFDAKAKEVDSDIPELDFTDQFSSIDQLSLTVSSLIKSCETYNTDIHSDFSEVFSGDLASLLENAEKYRKAIELFQSRLKKITAQKVTLQEAESRLSATSEMIESELGRQKKLIDARWATIQKGHEDWSEAQRTLMNKILSDREITLEGEVIFDADEFLTRLKKELNLRSFKAGGGLSMDDKVRSEFNITDTASFFTFMKDRLHQVAEEAYVSGSLVGLFYDVSVRSEYLRVEPVISYGGRPLERLSVGQKGTVYLCMKLATQAFSQPLVFDQPEDDLDNEFIIEHLVGIFREIKLFRQVILVSHNANLVVNADAEQIVLATNDNGVLKYNSGSLECSMINLAVRTVLEGGDDAFRKRESRYNLAEN